MAKLSLLFSLGLLICCLEKAYGNGQYYYYPDNTAALTYQYQPYAPYLYAPYAVAAAPDCDKKKEEGSSESSSSSSESSSSESSEEGKEEKEEGKEESKEGEEKEGSSEESKEEGKEEGSSSESKEEGKEEKKEKKKEKKEKKEEKPFFPPVTYQFPPRPAQVVYSSPMSSYPYVPMKSYSVVPQSVAYRSSYPSYYSYPSATVARVVSSPVSKIISPAAYSGKSIGYNAVPSVVGASSAYWAPSANLGWNYKA